MFFLLYKFFLKIPYKMFSRLIKAARVIWERYFGLLENSIGFHKLLRTGLCRKRACRIGAVARIGHEYCCLWLQSPSDRHTAMFSRLLASILEINLSDCNTFAPSQSESFRAQGVLEIRSRSPNLSHGERYENPLPENWKLRTLEISFDSTNQS